MPCPSDEAVPAVVQALALKAKSGRLVIYAGAGVSAAAPTDLPVGPQLAERAAAWLSGRVAGLRPYDDQNLLDVADAVEAKPGGRDLLQEALTELAEFGVADPNYAHRAIALLLVEGAAVVLTTNWDDCIERAAPPGTRLQVVVDDVDFAKVRGAAVLKVHGCASRLGSLLVSTQDLTKPPLWVSTGLTPHLSASTIVFVGIGDIAAYVRVRIHQLLADAGISPDLRVVSPGIVEKWTSSQWSKIPGIDVPEDHRIAEAAEAFLDELLRAYVGLTVSGLREDLSNHALTEAAEAAVSQLLTAMSRADAATLLEWLRQGRLRLAAGLPADGPQLRTALLAAGTLATASCALSGDGWLSADGELVLVLAGDGSVPGPRLADAARERVSKALSQGTIRIGQSVRVVCAGFRGPLAPSSAGLVSDIVEPASVTDIISGPGAQSISLLDADELLRGAA